MPGGTNHRWFPSQKPGRAGENGLPKAVRSWPHLTEGATQDNKVAVVLQERRIETKQMIRFQRKRDSRENQVRGEVRAEVGLCLLMRGETEAKAWTQSEPNHLRLGASL